jgi:acetoin utilization deacetylase AcuC-like enzyme
MLCASNKVLAKHQTPPGHPEQAGRIIRIREYIEEHLGTGTITTIDRSARKEELNTVHSCTYIDYLFSLKNEAVNLDYETFFSEGTLESVLAACGICLELIEHIVHGTYKKCFALIRPPGHHAGYDYACGYCIVNNMAVAVKKALLMGIKRIAIIDWDVHHGNGTQEIFEETNSVYVIDIHQDNLFPLNSGMVNETGKNAGKGFTLNIPVPAGSDGNYYLDILNNKIYPVLKNYKPDLICISSGFDALKGDSESNMSLVPEDYQKMTKEVCRWADEWCGGRLFMLLEGGYNIDAVPKAVGECISVLRDSESK